MNTEQLIPTMRMGAYTLAELSLQVPQRLAHCHLSLANNSPNTHPHTYSLFFPFIVLQLCPTTLLSPASTAYVLWFRFRQSRWAFARGSFTPGIILSFFFSCPSSLSNDTLAARQAILLSNPPCREEKREKWELFCERGFSVRRGCFVSFFLSSQNTVHLHRVAAA